MTLKSSLNVMKLLSVALVTSSLLIGCAKEHTSSLGLTVVEYDKQFQEKVAKEVESGKAPALNEVAKDCLVLRDQVRVK